MNNINEMDINYYKIFNPDLKRMNNQMLENHFKMRGYKENRIYNEASFYNAFPDFDYIVYGDVNEDLNKTLSKFDLERHYYYYGRFEKRIKCKKELIEAYPYSSNNIIIYPHLQYNEADGGINVMYYLAKLLEESGKIVRIYPSFGKPITPHFNKYYDDDFPIMNSYVIYCEGTKGNPLNAKYVIRWILSPIGLNVPRDYCLTWGKNELLYYFNNESRFNDLYYNSKIKLLPIIMLDEKFKDYSKEEGKIRNEKICYTYRKSHIHKFINKIHDDDSFNITRDFNNNKLIEIFNNYTYFYSYDPLTFLSVLAAKCGCISVVYPIDGVSKEEWYKMSGFYYYLKEREEELYGIAYGLDDIEFAKNSINKVDEQWKRILDFNKEKYLNGLINDINNYEYGFGDNCMKNFDINFI